VANRGGVCVSFKLENEPSSSMFRVWLGRALEVSKLLSLLLVLGVVAQSQTITTIAGGGPAGTGLKGTTTPIGLPWGVVQDSSGNTYISDNLSNRIFKVDTSVPGNLSVLAGNGLTHYSGDGGSATAATFNGPEGIAVDSNGLVYIADTFNNVIRVVNTSTTTSYDVAGVTIAAGNIATVAGDGTQCASSTGACGDAGLATLAQISSPAGVAVDASGNIFIADTGDNKIREVVTTGIITTVAGTGTAAAPVPGTATNSPLSAPGGVFVDTSGNLYIADTGNNVVEQVTSGNLSVIAGTGTACSPSTAACGDGGTATTALLNAPADVYVQGGNIYIADTNDFRVREIIAGTISTIAGNGVQCTSSISSTCGDGTATSAELNFPTGIFVSGSGVWIADQSDSAVRSVASGNISRFAGIYFNRAYYGDGGLAIDAELQRPGAITLDSVGDVFIADAQNNAIRKVSTSGNISTVAGTGSPCKTATCGDGGPVASATLLFPSDVAVDASGNIYIADSQDNVVRVVNTSTADLTFFGGTANELIVHTGDIATVAGTITASACSGTASKCGDGGPATLALLNSPSGLFLDGSGNIYIADTGDNVIRFVNTQASGTPTIKVGTVSIAPGDIATVAGDYTACSPSTAACGDGANAAQAHLSSPGSVFLNSAGYIYVTDSGDNRIRVVNPNASAAITVTGISISAGDIATVAGNGTSGYSGDGHAANIAELSSPGGVFVDVAGDIFIADFGNSVVREVNGQSGNIQTVAGDGAFGFSGDGGAPLSAELARPTSLRGDSSGDLFVSDTGASRVRKATKLVATAAPPPPPAPSFTLPKSGTLKPASLSAGTSATGTVTVTSVNSFNSAVTLTCSVSPSPTNAPGCSVQSPVTPSANGSASTLTVTTTAATSSSALVPAIKHPSNIFYATLLLPAMLFSTAGMGSSRRKKAISCILLVLAVAGCVFLVACGGGSGSSTPPPGGSSGTPSGSYTITVTGTSGSINQTETFTLTVQ
jgi:trimeric autotransporter adhesin